MSLESALHHCRELYRGIHRSKIDTNSAYRVMGFVGKTGASATAMGAVRQFGLVDGLRGDLSVSDLALRILEPANGQEKLGAIIEASTQPEVFERVLAHFNHNLPVSNEAIRAFLIRQLDFSGGGADDCIKSLRETLAFVDDQKAALGNAEDVSAPVAASEPPTSEGSHHLQAPLIASMPSVGSPALTTSSGEFFRLPLSNQCVAEVRITGEITGEGIERLIEYLKLMRGFWTSSPD